MKSRLKVLIVEDVATDADLVARELKKAGLDHQMTRVETQPDFLRTLETLAPDIILSDFSMPRFDGLTALELARAKAPDTPFIFVSGTIGEEVAIESLKRGAADYILKTNLKRLGPAVERALRDVEERRARLTAERQLNETRVRFELFMRYLPGAAFIKDAQGRYQYVNWSWEEIRGRKMPEVLGRTDGNLWPELAAQLENNDRLVIDRNDALRSIETFPGPDGVHHYLVHKFPIRDGNGQPVLVGGIAIDYTDRLRAEEEVRESEARFRDLLEFAPEAMVIVDASGEIRLVNAQTEALFGYQRSELLGQRVEILLPVLIRDGHVRHRAEYQINPQARAMGAGRELLGRRKDGTEFFAEVSLSPLETRADRLFMSAIRDITERKIQEQKIARLSRIQEVLSGINSAIVRIRDREELFQEACRIAVEHGKFTLAWIGALDLATQDVTPVAVAGRDDGYLDQIELTADEEAPRNCKLLARALSSREPVVCNDIAADERMSEWRMEALKRGYRAVVVFPLITKERPAGVFVLYAPEPGFFDEQEMELLIEMAGDISFALDHIAKEEKLNYLAYYDVLTGLPNRSLFDDRMAQHLRVASHEKSKIALVLINLDRFRVINETLGRNTGDGLLKLVAERLLSVVFDRDSLARIQTDVFAILFPGIRDDADIARIVEEKIIGCLNQPFTIAGQELRVSAKAGVALFPGDATEPEALFSSAEAALRQAKDSSDRYLFYARKMNAMVAERLKLENKLQRALERDEFVLFYQPKVDLNTGRVAGLEALIRWNDPGTGLVPPMLFIPLLEETGMIVEVGAWAMKQAVSQYAVWRAAGLPPLPIAVNVSQVQLKRKEFATSVQQAIAIAGKPDHGLDLEITESMIMEDIESSIEKLKLVRELGVGIAIDDFGTGHSSLRYLTRLPLTALKIDIAFVRDMTTNPDNMAIVSTIITLARTMNLKVIAEGVETDEQSKLLRLLKCDEFQGYLFSKPLPVEQLTKLLAERRAT